MRHIVDGSGERWEVRATIPAMPERRRRERRGVTGEDRTPTRGPIADRRRRMERRRILQSRVAVSPGLEAGWLTFDSGHEKRRFAPIPDAWDQLPDEALVRLCAQATRVALPRRRLIE